LLAEEFVAERQLGFDVVESGLGDADPIGVGQTDYSLNARLAEKKFR
jgi:hypothetical protein